MGELYATLSAVIWAGAVIFLKRSGESVSPFALNLFRVALTGPLLVITLLIARQPLLYKAPVTDYLILFASGIIAIAISDTLFHHSLNMIGAGISAIVGCTYSPFTIVFGFMLLGERLAIWQFVGMGLVLAGIVIATGHRPPQRSTPRQILVGVIWGILAMASVGIGIVIAKPVLNRSPVLWATAVRQIGSLVVLVPAALLLPARRETFRVFRPSPSWKFSIPATLLGSYVALIVWIAGMKYTKVGIAAILNQSSAIFILLLAAIFLKEALTLRKIAASALALAGIAVVALASIM